MGIKLILGPMGFQGPKAQAKPALVSSHALLLELFLSHTTFPGTLLLCVEGSEVVDVGSGDSVVGSKCTYLAV